MLRRLGLLLSCAIGCVLGVVTAVGAADAVRQSVAAGHSVVLTSTEDITRVAVTDPSIANATVVDPRSLLVDGKTAGTVSLIVWGREGILREYDIEVVPATSPLQARFHALFPGEAITASATEDAVFLSGRVTTPLVAQRAAEVAAATAPKARVVNLLEATNGPTAQQVQLQVRFAEVSRRALTELGLSVFTSATGVRNTLGRVGTQQFAAPGFDKLEFTKDSPTFGAPVTSAKGEITFSDFLNLFVFSERYDLGAMVKALKGKGLFQSLAEPNLMAYNGQEASFLAGGQIPVPVAQGLTSAVTVQWKEYGVRLHFTPTITGDRVRLRVEPEVSALDFGNAIALNGFRIPAISTRRTETTVELRDGQTFAVGGLIDNTLQEDFQKMPGIGDIPILGAFFRSRARRAERTELIVLITPTLVPDHGPVAVPTLPVQPGQFLPSLPPPRTR
mgnify:CR=1 FL=1